MTLEVLICSLNKGIVRVPDCLCQPRPDVRYIVSYQYTDERYLDLMPKELVQREDVTVYTLEGQGLSINRNNALKHASADIVMFADDDTRFSLASFDSVLVRFEKNPEMDVAFFCATTYTGKQLKEYPSEPSRVTCLPESYTISAIEIAARRESIQDKVLFDERFGLGSSYLVCGEEDVWLTDAIALGLRMEYFPVKVVETSTMLKKSLIYVDPCVQRARGAFMYYTKGIKAWLWCFHYALTATRKGYAHFFPLLFHMLEGVRYLQKHPKSCHY